MDDALGLRHDVLDAQLVDRHCDRIGRCDVLMLELREGQPPRVAEVLVGGAARDARIGGWMIALTNLFRGRRRDGGVSRIPFSAVRTIDTTIQFDVLRDELASEHVERWLAGHVIARIPGGGEKGE